MGIYVFLARRAARPARRRRREGLRPRGHSVGARPLPRQRPSVPRLLGRRRHGRVVLRREHHADAGRRAVQVLRSAPADLHASALPAGLAAERLHGARRDHRRRLLPRPLHGRGVDHRHPHQHPGGRDDPPVGPARRRLLRGRRCGAGARRRPAARHRPRRRARPRDRRQERPHRRRRAAGQRSRASSTPTATATTSATASSSCPRTA